MHASRKTRAALVAVLGALTAAAVMSSGGGAANASPTANAAGTRCGLLPNKPAPALLKSLPPKTQAYYDGWADLLGKSQWANFKPKHKGKFTIGYSSSALVNPFNAALYKDLQTTLKKNKQVGKVIFTTTDTLTDVQQQIQQIQSMIQQKADVIIVLAVSGPALTQVVGQAAKAGIPVISLINDIGSPAISIAPNSWTEYGGTAASLMKQLGGKGNVIFVHGIPSTATDVNALKVTKEIIANCPSAKLIGDPVGNYVPPVVEGAVLSFLTSHPQKISAVFQAGTMAQSIMQAFQKAGRTIPSVDDVATSPGSLAYWKQNVSKGYKGAGSAAGPMGLTLQTVDLTTRLLGGQGPKVNAFVWYHPLITPQNLSGFTKSLPAGASLSTQGLYENPPSTYLPKAVVDSLMSHPKVKPIG
jgi:ribose transport system substrate-binding protein